MNGKEINRKPAPIWVLVALIILLDGYLSASVVIDGERNVWHLVAINTFGTFVATGLWVLINKVRNPNSKMSKHVGLLAKIGAFITAALTLISILSRK